MNDRLHTVSEAGHAPDSTTGEERERRELIIMRAGAHLVGVYADEADHVTERPKTTPLPFAPPAIAGVACVRGRMRTVIDPVRLFDKDTPASPHAADQTHTPNVQTPTGETQDAPPRAQEAQPAFIVALRNDEQLALAVECVEGIVEIQTDALQTHEPARDFTRGLLQHEGRAIHILDPARLFETAMQGTERRRPRNVGDEQ